MKASEARAISDKLKMEIPSELPIILQKIKDAAENGKDFLHYQNAISLKDGKELEKLGYEFEYINHLGAVIIVW
jgi:hypothetical protein